MPYEINLCSPLYDQLQDQTANLRVIRILLGVDLLLLCFIYNLISFLLKKDINSLRLEDKESNNPKISSLQRFYKKWENQFLLSFGDHVVSVGFVMTFSPFGFELFLASVFFLLRLAYEVRLQKWESQTKWLKTSFRIINMGLLVSAMVGLSRTSYDSSSNCNDASYQLLL